MGSREKHTSRKVRSNMERPNFVTDEHLDYLDDLRESGVTNMFGASPYVEQEFGLDRKTAINILKYWMESFGKEER